MNAIRATRITKKLTQKQLADALCVDRTTITKWETGKSLPRADKLIKLAALLECSIEQLLAKKS